MSKNDAWTPYGLEAYRVQHIARRRILAALILLLILGILWATLQETTDRQLSLSVNGRDVGQGGIQLAEPDRPDVEDRVTVSLEPGRVMRAATGGEAAGPSITRNTPAALTRGTPINWNAYLMLYGPFVLLGLLVWFLGKRRGRHDELNYGVYKGSMPFEMITASQSRLVFTRKHAKNSVFGKRRDDHLPRELARGAAEEDA